MANRLGLQEEKRIEDTIIKNIKNLFKLKKENEAIEYFWRNNYIE